VNEHEIGDEYLTEKQQHQLLLDEEALRETTTTTVNEHEIGDEYLTEKQQHQLLLDEEALRETLEEEARAKKEWGRELGKNKLMMSYSGCNLG
ncbi:hypothetical protein Tco_0430663, partial [Tanacetum coccineum]